jgi:hypothetical protein
MGENYGFCRVVPVKYSLHGSCWQNIDSVRLIQLRKSGASGRRRSISARSKLPSMDLIHYVNCIKRSITTMPTIFRVEVIDGVWVRGILEGRGG